MRNLQYSPHLQYLLFILETKCGVYKLILVKSPATEACQGITTQTMQHNVSTGLSFTF